jgi:outer membrane protein OmpA-like peptidoglycan-associated protein
MAQFSEVQKKWVDRFLERPDGNGATDSAHPDSRGLDGFDSGKVQAITPGQVIGPATQVGKAALNWVNKQGVTTIIIENHSSKVLSRVDGSEELTHPKEAKWVKKAPPEIPAAKDGNPGKATITVKTDKLIRGVTRANTSGWVMYEIVGEVKKNKVKIAWLRKGDGTLDTGGWGTESGLFDIRGFQSNEGEFTFRFTEKSPAAKPKDPQSPEPKPQEPQSGGGKDSKSAAPADTYVLFEQGKFRLTSEAKSRLHDFALAYLAAKSTAKIEVEGYASTEGQEASNRTLSFDRAEAVFNYLVDVEKLSKDNVQWHGRGVTSNFDPKKLEPNRRVRIKLL